MHNDEAEWAVVAMTPSTNLRDCGVKHTKTAHPLSYRPDLPLRSELRNKQYKGRQGANQLGKRWTLTAAEKKVLASRPLVYRKTQEAPNA